MVGVSPPLSTLGAGVQRVSLRQCNPQPGADRALLPGDVAILQKVKELREGGAGIVNMFGLLQKALQKRCNLISTVR